MTFEIYILLFLFVSGFVYLFPRYGIRSLIKFRKDTQSKIFLEDTLKHLYDYESKGLVCTSNSISGTLGASHRRVTMIIRSLIEQRLAEQHDDGIFLTSDGRDYALRIIRIHRLWERYLADETEIKHSKWHSDAEKTEHFLSIEDANVLAAKLGNPHYDPHGDPIPTSSGTLPADIGITVNRLKKNEFGKIIHIEDEPEDIFESITAAGLKIGDILKIESLNDNEIIAWCNDRNLLLPVEWWRNISVALVDGFEYADADNEKTLASLNPGEFGVVRYISKNVRGMQRRRLMDLGVLPGTKISAEFVSTGGDPVAYKIRGALIALRFAQAREIKIESF